jgi:hypothetical protein
MQLQILQHTNGEEQVNSAPSAFIEANTLAISLTEIKRNHLIPVFAKDNEPSISQSDFVEVVEQAARQVFPHQGLHPAQIRVSHPIKGRIPEARNKPAKLLEPHEETLYYERMAFLFELPGLQEQVGGNTLSLTLGGIKAYNLDNLGSKKGALEHFRLFIGFKNKVCTNLCIWTDGISMTLGVRSEEELLLQAIELFQSFQAELLLQRLERMVELSLSEHQFAHLVGRCRMYQFMPQRAKRNITPLQFGDSQLAQVVKAYYTDPNFGVQGDIPLWNLYNLFTEANKSSYIDKFLERGVSAGTFVEDLVEVLESGGSTWYLPKSR